MKTILPLVALVVLAAVALRVAFPGGDELRVTSRDGASGSRFEAPSSDGVAGSPVVVARSLGKLESRSEDIGVSSDLTGRIVEILVEEGDLVTAGQPLVRLDDTLYRARLDAAEAAVRAAEARRDKLVAGARVETIRRARALLEEAEARATIARERAQRAGRLEEEGASSTDEADWLLREADAREAQVKALREELAICENETRPEDRAAAEAELEQARRELAARQAELEKATLLSPIDGTIVRRNLRVGEAVSSLQVEPVVTVADLTHLRIRAEVDEIDIGKVTLGQHATAESESFPELVLEGRVVRLGKTMGRKRIKSMDPNERQDVRVREVLIDLEGTFDLPLGLRLIVSFYR